MSASRPAAPAASSPLLCYMSNMPPSFRFFLVLAFTWLVAACAPDEPSRTDVQILLERDDPGDLQAAADRLAKHGCRALVPIEAAFHSADERGRRNLILALHRIGHEDAIPLLRHLALHDPSAAVRREARWTLVRWAKQDSGRGTKARAALRGLDEQTDREETG